MPGLEHVWHDVDGVRLHAVRSQDGPAPDVVLVHGVVVSGRYMLRAARLLAGRCRVHVPDLPSHGASGHPDHALTVEQRADALAAWMDAVGIRQAHLVGNSSGCQVIAALVERDPRRALRVVLQGPTMDRRARTLGQQSLRWLAASVREPGAPRAIVLADFFRMGPRRALQTILATLDDPIEDRLPDVRCPALVVRGTLDTIVPRRWAEELVRRLPDGRLVTIVGAGHTLNHAHAELFVDQVLAPFLDLPAAAPRPSAPAPGARAVAGDGPDRLLGARPFPSPDGSTRRRMTGR